MNPAKATSVSEPMHGFCGLTVIVPTRNRADLAISALDSILNVARSDVRVLVSDNSTRADQRKALIEYCDQRDPRRLQYVSPPEPLPMSPHWDWAVQRAVADEHSSHITLLTDRMLFLPSGLDALVTTLQAFPRDVVSYYHDRVVDHRHPITLDQYPWTGRALRISSDELLISTAKLRLHCPAFPKMLNTAVPKALLLRIQEKFGNIFDSISPDYSFCFRCLAVVDSIVYLDRSVLIHYALDRSNGASLERDVPNDAQRDFTADHAQALRNFDTPLPNIPTVGNAILHEYQTVRQEVASNRFPEIDFGAYLRYLSREVNRYENGQLKHVTQEALSTAARTAGISFHPWVYRYIPPGVRLRPTRLAEHLIWKVFSAVRQIARRGSRSERPKGALQRKRIGFGSTEEALEYAKNHPRWRSWRLDHLAECGPFEDVTPVMRRESSSVHASETAFGPSATRVQRR